MDWKTEFIIGIIDLLPVIAGAILGFAGGFLTTISAQKGQSKREKYKELRSNLLTVTLEVSKISVWLEKEASYYTASSGKEQVESASRNPPAHVEPSPMQKIEAIVSLYFPEILDYARELASAGTRHRGASVELSKALDKAERKGGSKDDVKAKIGDVGIARAAVLQKKTQFEKVARELMTKLLNEKS